LTAYYVISYDMEIKAGTKFRFNIGVLESGGWSSEVLILPSGSLGVKKLSNDDLLEEWKKWVWENEEIYRESGFYIGGSRVAVTVRIEGTREKVRILGLGEAGYDFSYDTTRAEYAAKFMEMGSQIYMSNEEENLRVTAYQLWDEVHGAKEGKKFVYEGVETSGGTWQQICDSIRNREGVGVKEFQILLSIWKNPNVPEYEYKRENETKVISADCAFNFELASDTSDEVRWLANSRALIAGTQAAEWYIPPGVNALNIRAEQRSRNGSGRLQAVQAAEILAFAQSGRKKIKTCYVPEQEESYRTGDIMELNPEIISESAVKYMDFSSTPESRLFVVKDDGTMAVCLIEGGRAAWSRFVLGRGRIESAAVVPGASGEDEVYLAAETGGVRYLLVVDESIHSDNYYSGNGDVFRSVATSMPVAAGDPYGKKRITGIAVRFNESSMPKIVTDGRVETITGVSEPYSGIVKRPAPSSWDRDVFFTLEHDKDAPCVILAVNAEAG
jgi:hypothetical protein